AGPADDLAAPVAHDFGRVVFEIVAKAVIDRDEEPVLLATVDQCGADRVRDRVGVENVVYPGRCARLVAEPLSTRRAERHDLVAYVRDALDDLRLGGTADIENGVDMLVVEPLARDRAGAVAAVVVVRDD